MPGVPPHPAQVPGSPRARLLVSLAVVVLIVAAVVALVRLTTSDKGGGLGVDAAHRGPSANKKCTVSATLVPSCGHWFGIAPMAHTDVPVQTALPEAEKTAGRTLDIVHVYHTNGDLFPTSAERALALQPGHHRLLLENWKPSTSVSWAAVANGAIDSEIDREAAYIKQTFHHRFFLTIWHEPENDVKPSAGSGWTANDYRHMYQHVVARLRSDGVTWAVTVMNYMGFDNWTDNPWFHELWPGRQYVDWLAIDPYGTGGNDGYTATNFPTLVNRPYSTGSFSFAGFYSWARTHHPLMPIMLAEWGVAASPSNPTGQAAFLHNVQTQLHNYPDIKALVYFDMPNPPAGEPRTWLKAEPQTVKAYRSLVNDPKLIGPRVP